MKLFADVLGVIDSTMTEFHYDGPAMSHTQSDELALKLHLTCLQLKRLSFAPKTLSAAGIDAIGSLVVRNNIQILELPGNDVHGRTLSRLMSKLAQGKSLQTLDLSQNPLSYSDADAIADVVANNNLQTLKLSSCRLNGSTLSHLMNKLARCKSLQTLDLSHNELRYGDADAIGNALPNSRIQILKLSGCSLNGSTLSRLMSKLARCKNLMFLDLADNQLRDCDAHEIARHLQYLPPPDDGRLSPYFSRHSYLEKLRLTGNSLSQAAVSAFTRALSRNMTLTHVLFDDGLDTSKLDELLEQNRELRMLLMETVILTHDARYHASQPMEEQIPSAVGFNPLLHYQCLIYLRQTLELKEPILSQRDQDMFQGYLLALGNYRRTVNNAFYLPMLVASSTQVLEPTLPYKHLIPAALDALALNPALEELEIRSITISTRETKQLAAAIEEKSSCSPTVIWEEPPVKRTSLKKLTLCDNQLQSDGAARVAKILRLKTLQRLWLWQNPIRDEGVRAIVKEETSHGALQELGLNACAMSDDGAIAIAELLEANTKLDTVSVCDNEFSVGVMPRLVKSFTSHTTLAHLYLSGNHATNSVMPQLAEFVEQSRTLKTLVLDDCNIDDAGATRIAHAAERSISIDTLSLANNKVGDIGATSLQLTVLLCTTLRSIDLSSNPIRATTVLNWCSALSQNPPLSSLSLAKTNIATALPKLIASLQNNTRLRFLNLTGVPVNDADQSTLSQLFTRNTQLHESEQQAAVVTNEPTHRM